MSILEYLKFWLNAFIRFPIFIWTWFWAHPVPYDVAKQRLDVCYDCDRFNIITRQCTECWCYMNLKVQWHNTECPLLKWSRYEKD